MGHTDKVTVKLGLPSIRGADESGESGVSVLTCVEVLASEIQEWNKVLRALGLRVVLDIRIEDVPKEGSE